MMGLLDVRGLGVVIDGGELLADVSFSLTAGEQLMIIGPNGAGKTLLLRLYLVS